MIINAKIAKVDAAAVQRRLDLEAPSAVVAPALVEIIDTDYRGVPAMEAASGARYVAVAASGRRNAAEWAVLEKGADLHVDNVVCYLKRREVRTWLARAER